MQEASPQKIITPLTILQHKQAIDQFLLYQVPYQYLLPFRGSLRFLLIELILYRLFSISLQQGGIELALFSVMLSFDEVVVGLEADRG